MKPPRQAWCKAQHIHNLINPNTAMHLDRTFKKRCTLLRLGTIWAKVKKIILISFK